MQILKHYSTAIIFVIFLLASATARAEVCAEEEIAPPFLTEGVAANLLLVIDNSASMYDMAYDDVEEPGYCNDDSYIWQGTINSNEEWDASVTYRPGAFAFIYMYDVNRNLWEKYWYKAPNVATTGEPSPDDTTSGWTRAEWAATTDYPTGSIAVIPQEFVQNTGSILITYSWYTAIADGLADDGTGTPTTCYNTDPLADQTCWRRIPSEYGGYFEADYWYEWNDTARVFVPMNPQPADSSAACIADSTAVPPETRYRNDDFCQVEKKEGFVTTVESIAAKGNFLNWVVSSKFDVEKRVLTGGKLDQDYFNSTGNVRLVNESRGCLDRRMIRQTPVQNDGGSSYVLTLGVRKGEPFFSTDPDAATCIANCTPVDPTCSSQCSSRCNTICQDQTWLDNCLTTLNSCTATCITSSPSAVQQQNCIDQCNTDYSTCTAATPVDATCFTDCNSSCDTFCIDECESECNRVWADEGLREEQTRIEFFEVSPTGFQFANAACEAAVQATQQGQVANLAQDCLEIGKQNESFANSNAAFNQGIQTCWTYSQGIADGTAPNGTVGTGDISRMINACENIYREGVVANSIESTDSGYVCNDKYVGGCMLGLAEDATCVYDPCPSPLAADQRCIDNRLYECPVSSTATYVWEPTLNTCILDNGDGTFDQNTQSPMVVQFTGNCKVAWTADYDYNLDDLNLILEPATMGCVEWAIRDFCDEFANPPVPDVDSPVQSVADDEMPNLTAILVDIAANAQLGEPIKTIPSMVRTLTDPDTSADTIPKGILQKSTKDLRVGAMTFNSRGTLYELDNYPTSYTDLRETMYGCSSADPNCTNQDSGRIIDYMTGTGYSDGLISSINNIKAETWTPMTEAMYDAIGYYTRDNRLNTTDFYKSGDSPPGWAIGQDYELGDIVKDSAGRIFWATNDPIDPNPALGGIDAVSAGNDTDLANGSDTVFSWELLTDNPAIDPDPVQAYCQANNILLLTDGAPTADWHQTVWNDLKASQGFDATGDLETQCGRYYGDTYLDDIAKYGNTQEDLANSILSIYSQEQFKPLYPYEPVKNPIKTYVVTTGALRIDGAEDECRADVLLNETADAGGTNRFYPGEDINQLEEQLRSIFQELRTRASAGSAASVISASRGGEGAVYQAIFWPEKTSLSPSYDEYTISWAGEVHGLFVDDNGFLFEDTNGNRKLDRSEDINGNGVYDNEDVYNLADTTDPAGNFLHPGDGILQTEDLNCNGILDNEDTNGDGQLSQDDLNCNNVFDPAYEDVNGDGIFNTDLSGNEDTNCDGTIDVVIIDNGVIDNEDKDCNGVFDYEDANCNGQLDQEPDTVADGVITTEDTNGNCRLDDEDLDGDGTWEPVGDKRILVYFDESYNESRGCYNIQAYFDGIANTGLTTCIDNGTDVSVSLDDVAYLWSAEKWLEGIDNTNITINRDVATYLSNPDPDPSNAAGNYLTDTTGTAAKRFIFTWNDLDNDGIVDYADDEVFPLEQGAKAWIDPGLVADGTVANEPYRAPVANDFNTPVPNNAAVNNLINWTRGLDLPNDGFRDRTYYRSSTTPITWRLGDIIHSTPMTVAAPAEGYQFLYGDLSYAQFAAAYNKRRHVIYFGGNDGMLHAVNGGFYDSETKKFWYNYNTTDGYNDISGPPLGAELWAYVPYNLTPHLGCLAQPDYKHKYYVDLRPRIFDAQIFFESDGTPMAGHTNGWGTILVGGMRFGGAPVKMAKDIDPTDSDQMANPDPDDIREFISSYFILDITNPEKPPVLLGEFTQTLARGGDANGDSNPDTDGDGILEADLNTKNYVDLGFSTVIPTMVIMKQTHPMGSAFTPLDYTDDTSYWYLVFGSGPHGDEGYRGVSDQNARISILPLNNLVTGAITTPSRAMRVSAAAPTAADGGTLVLPNLQMPDGTTVQGGFVSDPVTIDYDIAPSSADYKSDAVYFGTVEGKLTDHPNYPYLPYWEGGGTMYRLVTRKTSATYGETAVAPNGHGRGVVQEDTTPDQWYVAPLLTTFADTNENGTWDVGENGQPITASASVGFDGSNFWVYFGTGRFFDPGDKTDATQQSYYGLKEPMKWYFNDPPMREIREFTWSEIELGATNNLVGDDTQDWVAGDKGLLKVDEILVPLAARPADALLSCRNNDPNVTESTANLSDCLPSEVIVNNNGTDEAYFGHFTEPNLVDYIAGFERTDPGDKTKDINECVSTAAGVVPYQNCVDGWYKDFWPYDNRERNIGQATLLGGLLTFTTYQPFADICRAEGLASLYGVYYRTGTAWYQDIFGTYTLTNNGQRIVKEKLDLGRGLATSPNLHVGYGTAGGEGTKAFVQTSTGEIKEIKQENLPIKNYKTGRSKWLEYLD